MVIYPAEREIAALTAVRVRELARRAGFELSGIASPGPVTDYGRYTGWVARGQAGKMGYLTDRRAALREDVRSIAPFTKSVICVGKLYNGPEPRSTEFDDPTRAWISRYAWGEDYHRVVSTGLERLASFLDREAGPLQWKACVDTAPLLERSLARDAGLGWIGKNTCLINQASGSWFFLGELLTDLRLEASRGAAPDRCGSCSRCIDACPTQAIMPSPDGRFEIDSRLCISYLTIELRGSVDEPLRAQTDNHVFGCDICQDVCPWNRRAPVTTDTAFAAHEFAPPLARLAALSEDEFQQMFRNTPIERARYRGFLRNVAIAMGNSRSRHLVEPLEMLCQSPDLLVAEHARTALRSLLRTLD